MSDEFKDMLCSAFCASLNIRTVPAGYAVETPYTDSDGDPLVLYYVRQGTGDRWRIEDDGTQVPLLEANGVDLSGKARGEALSYLLTEYGAYYDREARVIHTTFHSRDLLGAASIKFVALLLRLQDLALLSPHVVRNTFREDVLAAIKQTFGPGVEIEEQVPVSSELAAYNADCLITSREPSIAPLAIYLGVSEERALQALVLKMEMEKYRSISTRVVLMLEKAKENPLRESTYALAQARLDDVLSFRGVEVDAMQRLQRDFSNLSRTLQ
jgi:hypothetical protein